MSRLTDVPVLVTGGAGFIGSHLVESLVRSKANVTVLDNLSAGSLDNLRDVESSISVVVADVRSAADLGMAIREARPKIVFHLAANASVPGSVDDPQNDFEANALGTFNLLEQLRQAGCCERVVLASSGAVYGQPEVFPISESTALKPISPYGASKLSAETAARMFCDVYQVGTVVARLFNTYGPRMARFVVLDFLRKLRKNPLELEVLGDGEQIRDFTYVADTVAGLKLLAEHGKAGEAYNVSSGTSHSITCLANELLSLLDLQRTGIHYTGKSWKGDAVRWDVCIDKLASLGYMPAFGLQEGLRQTVQWFEEDHAQKV